LTVPAIEHRASKSRRSRAMATLIGGLALGLAAIGIGVVTFVE
jgi:hypothetical protein